MKHLWRFVTTLSIFLGFWYALVAFGKMEVFWMHGVFVRCRLYQWSGCWDDADRSTLFMMVAAGLLVAAIVTGILTKMDTETAAQ